MVAIFNLPFQLFIFSHLKRKELIIIIQKLMIPPPGYSSMNPSLEFLEGWERPWGVQQRLASLQLGHVSGCGLPGTQAGYTAGRHHTPQSLLGGPGRLCVLPNGKMGGLGPTKPAKSVCLRKTALHTTLLCMTRLVLCLDLHIQE